MGAKRTNIAVASGAAMGHLWTLSGAVGGSTSLGSRWWRKGRDELHQSTNWSTTIEDERRGRVVLSGQLEEILEASTIVIVVHGLGGSAKSPYVQKMAAECRRFGWSSLCITLRGSDLRGQDFYHAGLIADLDAALNSDEVAKYSKVHIVGYSLGGHMVLRWSTFQTVSRGKIVAICPPLDLYQSVLSIDRPSCWLYRQYLLHGLRLIYKAVAERHSVPFPIEKLASIRRVMDWDEHIVAPYHGFLGARDYYQKMSVDSRLKNIQQEALIIYSTHDPMVRWETISSTIGAKEPLPECIKLCLLREGGHCAFSSKVDLGFNRCNQIDGRLGFDSQVLEWCSS